MKQRFSIEFIVDGENPRTILSDVQAWTEMLKLDHEQINSTQFVDFSNPCLVEE
jgi:hypothetical protein